MKYGLQSGQIAKIQRIFMKYPVEKAILYGSRAKGSYKENSDIDIVLQGITLGARDISNIETELDELLLPYKFDLSIYHHLKDSDILDHIQKIGIIFYQRH